jgi:hypothetical protein
VNLIRENQKGFSILGVILISVAIVGVMGVWSISGQTNTSNSSSASRGVMGSGIVNDANAIKNAFDSLLINGVNSASIDYLPNTIGLNNILDPERGISRPRTNPSALGSSIFPKGQWVYHKNIKIMGVGSSAVSDYAIILPDVKDGVCQGINERIYGSSVIPDSGLTQNAFTLGATNESPVVTSLVDLSSLSAVNGWVSGCISATGGTAGASNLYFRILKGL